MKIFGRGKQDSDNLGNDDLDIVSDDAGFDDDGAGLSAPVRGMGGGRSGGNRKFVLLVVLLLVLGGGYAAMTMMAGPDLPAVSALPPAEPLNPLAANNAVPPAGVVDPHAPLPVDAAGMPLPQDAPLPGPDGLVPATAAEAVMPPMPDMPPMPQPPATDVTAEVTGAIAGATDANPLPADLAAAPAAVADPIAPVPPVMPAPLAPGAPDAALDAIDADNADMSAVAVTDTVAPPVPPGSTPADTPVPLPAPAATASAPAVAMDPVATAVPAAAPVPGVPAVPASVAAVPAVPGALDATAVAASDAEMALINNADLVPPAQDATQGPADLAALLASLPVEPAMVRPLPKQYLTVKKESTADSLDSRLASARRALNEGRAAAALQFFNDLSRDYPSDTRVLMGRAVTLQRLGQNVDALEAYETVLRADPKNLDALTNMLGLLKAQNPSMAIERLLELRTLYPYSADITTQLAIAYGDAGNMNEALRYITLAEALKPDSSYVLYNKAIVYDRIGRRTEAADMYRRLIRLSADGALDQSLPIETIKRRLAVMQ